MKVSFHRLLHIHASREFRFGSWEIITNNTNNMTSLDLQNLLVVQKVLLSDSWHEFSNKNIFGIRW